MLHLINGEAIPLREVSEERLHALVRDTKERMERVREELDSLCGELVRRADNVYQLRFDLPPHHDYDGNPAA